MDNELAFLVYMDQIEQFKLFDKWIMDRYRLLSQAIVIWSTSKTHIELA